MNRISIGQWIAIVGAILIFVALGSNFYGGLGEEGTDTAGAWFGVPHTSQLMLGTAVIAVLLAAFAAAGRSMFRGVTVGIITAVMGLLSTLWLGYRMLAPPFDFELQGTETWASLFSFDHCLWFCPPSQAVDASLLPGIWIGFIGTVAVLVGGIVHLLSRPARATPANFWVASRQTGMTPWLGVAGLGALGQFIFGYTFFPFYVTPTMDERVWSGWLPTPHTSMLVFWVSLIVIGLIIAASRQRAPVSPSGMGGLVAALGLVSGVRILYRMIEAPFRGGTVPAELQIGAYLAIVSALVIIVAGIVQGATHKEAPATTSPERERV